MALEKNQTEHKILVIRAGALGDTVCASSIIPALQAQFGNAVIIDWVAKSGIAEIFRDDPRIRHVFTVKSRRTPLLLNKDKIRILLTAMREPYDYIVNLELGNIFNGLVRLIPARKKVGMPYQYFAEPPEAHAVDNLKLIYGSFLDADIVKNSAPSLVGSPAEHIRNKFSLPARYFVLVPANSHFDRPGINHRAWPVNYWIELINLMAEQNITPVIIGGKSEANFFSRFDSLPAKTVMLAGKTSFPELTSIINTATAVVTTDTGPSHIAAAVNTPVIALIGPTNFKRTGPYQTGDNLVTILNANLPCSPCYHSAQLDNCTDNQCMKKITPGTVLNAMRNHDEQI